MAAAYKVLKIVEFAREGEAGGLVHAYRHTIKTKGGTILLVEIPEESFTPEKVDPILTKAAENADKVKSL